MTRPRAPIEGPPGFWSSQTSSPRMALARRAADTACARGIPVIFVQKTRRPDPLSFVRELDVHCLEGAPGTALAVKEMGVTAAVVVIRKRCCCAFFGADWRAQGRHVDPARQADGSLRALHLRGRGRPRGASSADAPCLTRRA